MADESAAASGLTPREHKHGWETIGTDPLDGKSDLNWCSDCGALMGKGNVIELPKFAAAPPLSLTPPPVVTAVHSFGKAWIDVDHRGGKMFAGIECEHPPADKHFLAHIVGPYNEKTFEAAQQVVDALNASAAPALSLTGLREQAAKWREGADECERRGDTQTDDGLFNSAIRMVAKTVAAVTRVHAEQLDELAAAQSNAQSASSGLRELVEKWREEAKDDARYGVKQAMVKDREFFGCVNAALAIDRCANELDAALRAATEAGDK